MLSDDLSQKAVSISVNSTKVSIKVLQKAISLLLSQLQKPSRGEQSIKKLNKQDYQLQDIPISDKDLKQFKQELNSYGVDYAIKRDISQQDTFKIYFKAKDVTQIENALKDYMAKQFDKDKKPSIKERMNQAIEKFKAQKAETKDTTKVRSREEIAI